jgi:hypothetical protein
MVVSKTMHENRPTFSELRKNIFVALAMLAILTFGTFVVMVLI